MKRYLQACDMDGTIYGKKRSSAEKKKKPGVKSSGKDDLVSDCNRFYKSQLSAMRKIFHNNG